MARRPKAPEEDPETKARRMQAEQRAQNQRQDSLQRMVTDRTSELLRRFGSRAAMAGAGGMAPSLGSFFGAGGQGGGSSYGGGATPGGTFRGGGGGGGPTISSQLSTF